MARVRGAGSSMGLTDLWKNTVVDLLCRFIQTTLNLAMTFPGQFVAQKLPYGPFDIFSRCLWEAYWKFGVVIMI